MPNSPPESSGSDPLSSDDVFALLGNKTRIGILQALWTAFEAKPGDNEIRFSELFEQVAIRDTGNFSYHLKKLTGPFVRSTDKGYELKQTGINVMQEVVAGTVTEDPEFGPIPVDIACPLCDAPVEVAYGDELITAYCTACEGTVHRSDEPGFLFGGPIPPVGIEPRTAEEAFRAAVTCLMHEVATFHDGICPGCSSLPETTVNICADHDAGTNTLCLNCDRTHMAEVWMICSTCKRNTFPPVRAVVLNDPNVTSFYHGHGIEHRFATWEAVVRSYEVSEKLVSEDPLRMRFTIPAGTDELHLTLDDELNVLDVT